AFNPLKQTLNELTAIPVEYVMSALESNFGIPFDLLEQLGGMASKMDLATIQFEGRTVPIFKPTDHERIDAYMGVQGIAHADEIFLDQGPGFAFYDDPVGPLNDNVEFDKQKFAAYKNAVVLAKLLLLHELPQPVLPGSASNGQLSKLVVDHLGGTYDWTLLNVVGSHGGNIFTTTLPMPGQTIDEIRESGMFLRTKLFLEDRPLDGRPWLRSIDGDHMWRTDYRTMESLEYRVSVPFASDPTAEWTFDAPAPGQYRVDANWLVNVSQRFDNPADDVEPFDVQPAIDAVYEIFDGATSRGTFSKNQGLFNSDVVFGTRAFDTLATVQIDSGILRVVLRRGPAALPRQSLVAGPILVTSIATGVSTVVARALDKDTLAPIAPPNADGDLVPDRAFADSGDDDWDDLVYATGNGNFPLWESEHLRPIFLTLFTDWQNGGENFPVLGDLPSPDPNFVALIPDTTIASYVSAFSPAPPSDVPPVVVVLNPAGASVLPFGSDTAFGAITGAPGGTLVLDVAGIARFTANISGLVAFTVNAEKIVVDPFVSIVVNGIVVLAASKTQVLTTFANGVIAFTEEFDGAQVVLGRGSSINGTDVTITATTLNDLSAQEQLGLPDDISFLEGLVRDVEDFLDDFTGQAVAVSAEAFAEVIVGDGVHITAGDDVVIHAGAETIVALTTVGDDGSVGYAITLAAASPFARVTVHNGAVIDAADQLDITSSADITLDVRAVVPASGDVAGLTLAVGRANGQSLVSVRPGARLEAAGILIASDNVNSYSTFALSAQFLSAFAPDLVGSGVTAGIGAAAALGFYQSFAQAQLAGFATADNITVRSTSDNLQSNTRAFATVSNFTGTGPTFEQLSDILGTLDLEVEFGDE
ncbi:MAG TPA: hypothetical protein VGK49_12350, partial [Ilumatobacteraceae bacterium]